MSDTSKYRKYHRSRSPVKRRRIKLWGVDEDTNKYIRCWHCGAIVNTDRDMGDPDHSGIVLTAVSPNPYATAPYGDSGFPIDPSTYHPVLSESKAGCWNCGCTNL